ncbi:MAG: SDR family oxidoreductase [Phycisphaerae bacterium]
MAHDKLFSGKVAVVTGAGGTLCSVMARDLAARGAKVALLGRTAGKLAGVVEEIIAAGGEAVAVSADVTDLASVLAAEREVAARLGVCDLLVNGAGGNNPSAVTTIDRFSPEELAEKPPEGLRGFFNIDLEAFGGVLLANTTGTVIPCQVFGRGMVERGMAGHGGGAIVNIASMNSYRPLTRNAAYGMAKAGVINFTQWLAAYLGEAGVRVNAIAPGFFPNDRSRKILTDAAADDGLTDRGRNVMAHTPMRRFGEPAELLGALRWLLDDEAAGFVTGICVPVDGGFLATSGV